MAHTKRNRKFTFPAALAFLLIVLSVNGAFGTGSDPTRNVGPGEAQELIRENAGNRDFVVLDVRTPEEYSQGHIEGAVLVDYRSPGFREEMAGKDRTKTYLVYCRTGNRSGRALEIMKELGFRSYYHLEGGITQWIAGGLPAVR